MIFFPLTALGQGAAYIGPHLGIQKARDADDANYLAGATLRLKLIPSLAAEGSVGYRQETYVDEAVTVRNWPVTVTGLFYPLPIVYGGVGAGWYHTTYDYDESLEDMGIEDNTNQEFGWHLALGAELPAGPKVAITGDVRYVFLDYSFADLPDVVTDDVDADFYSVTVGLLFRL
jgi:outer membrane protein W